MNERIKQLMLDAGGQYSSGNQNDWPSWVLGDAVVDKFAELLFNEIANTTVVSDGMFNGNERRLSVELRLGDMVKKISVFGVEG